MTNTTSTTAINQKHICAVEYNTYDNTYQLRNFLLRTNREPNTFQLVQQAMFAKASEFVLSLSSLLALSSKQTNNALHLSHVMSYVYHKAMSYVNNTFRVNYSKVLVSRGNLAIAHQAYAKAGIGCITFTWENDIPLDVTRHHDKAMLVVYCEALNKSIYIIGAARRQDRQAVLEVPQFHGYEVQTWLSFISVDKRHIADSSFTGAIFVT